MSEREPELYLLDILIAYEKFLRYTKTFECGDDLLNSELEIVGEATNNLIKGKKLNAR